MLKKQKNPEEKHPCN